MDATGMCCLPEQAVAITRLVALFHGSGATPPPAAALRLRVRYRVATIRALTDSFPGR